MNKLFTKITSLALGAAMMIGVGVTFGTGHKGVNFAEAASGDKYTFSATSGTSTDTNWSYTTAKNSGSTNPAWNSGSSELRLYPKNSITFTAKTGYTLTSASFTNKFNKKNGVTISSWTASAGTITTFSNTLTSFSVTEINASSLTITVDGSKGNIGLKTVTMTYTSPATTQTITVDPASGEAYSDESISLTTNAASANWALSNNTCGASLSAASGKTVTVSATGAGSVRVTATASGYTTPYVDLTFSKRPTSPYITPEKSSTSGYTGQNETISFSYGNLTGALGIVSSDTSVVTVETPVYADGEGTVQINFVGAGNTTVKFNHGSDELASLAIEVKASSVNITGLPGTSSVYLSETLDLGSLITVTATGSYSNAVTWSSDDTSIATVTSAGVVTGVSKGDAEITVTSKDYPSATMTCTVTVSEVVSYELVTNDGDLTEGSKLLFVCTSKNVAMAAQSGTYRGKTDVSISNNSIKNPSSSVKVVTLEGEAGAWYLNTDEGYLTSTAAKNLTSTSQKADAISWNISITDNNATIDGGTVGTIQYNASSPRFAPYTSAQTAIQIYGILAEETGTKIHLSAENIVMNYGDADVTPVVKNADTQEVISGCTFESGNTSVATIVNGKIHAVSKGTATITVNHDPDVQQEITYRSTTFTVTVNKADTIQDLYSYSSGTQVDFNGYYAGEYADGIVLMDGAYGVLVYKVTSESSWVVDETIINVSGSTTSYGGLLEIKQGSTVTELTGSEATAAAAKLSKPQNQDLTLIDPSTATLDVASRRTYVSGTLKSCTASGSNYNIVVTVNEKDVDLYLKAADDVEVELSTGTMKISAYLLANVENQVTIKGFTSFYNNNFQVRVYDVVEAVSSYTAADFAQDVLNDTDTVCSSNGESHDHKDALATIWSSLEGKWNTLAVTEQNEWQNTTKYTPDYENDSEEVIENGLGRYNYLCKKYSFTNFTHRSDVNDAPVVVQQSIINIFGVDNGATATTVIIIVSVIGVSALGGFFFLRKRKEI